MIHDVSATWFGATLQWHSDRASSRRLVGELGGPDQWQVLAGLSLAKPWGAATLTNLAHAQKGP
jgi:hypothetical protein